MEKERFLTHYVRQDHQILIGGECCDAYCKQEFCDPQPDTDSEYCQDTTTWD